MLLYVLTGMHLEQSNIMVHVSRTSECDIRRKYGLLPLRKMLEVTSLSKVTFLLLLLVGQFCTQLSANLRRHRIVFHAIYLCP
jgi:hypothetical protein